MAFWEKAALRFCRNASGGLQRNLSMGSIESTSKTGTENINHEVFNSFVQTQSNAQCFFLSFFSFMLKYQLLLHFKKHFRAFRKRCLALAVSRPSVSANTSQSTSGLRPGRLWWQWWLYGTLSHINKSGCSSYSVWSTWCPFLAKRTWNTDSSNLRCLQAQRCWCLTRLTYAWPSFFNQKCRCYLDDVTMFGLQALCHCVSRTWFINMGC